MTQIKLHVIYTAVADLIKRVHNAVPVNAAGFGYFMLIGQRIVIVKVKQRNAFSETAYNICRSRITVTHSLV